MPRDEWEPNDDGTKPGDGDGGLSAEDLQKIEATGLSVDELIESARSNLQPAVPAGSPPTTPVQAPPKPQEALTREEAAQVARVTAMTAVNQAGMESRVGSVIQATPGFANAGPEQISAIHRAVAGKLDQNVRIASGRASDAEVNAALDAATKEVMTDQINSAKAIAAAADQPELDSRLEAQRTAAVGGAGGASGKPSGSAGSGEPGKAPLGDSEAQAFGVDTTWPTEGQIEDEYARDQAKFEAGARTR